MLAYIMFFAAVLFALTIEIYGFNEAYNTLTKALCIASIILTAIIAAAAFIVCQLVDRGVIKL